MAKPPVPEIPSDWEEIHLPFNVGSGRTMYTGQESSGIARFRFYKRPGDNLVHGRAWFGPGSEGPPGVVHGGALAYVLDEAMGSWSWMNLYPAVAKKLDFEYLKMSPLKTDLHIEAGLVSAEKGRLVIASQVALPDGSVCVRGRGTFAVLSREQAKIFKKIDTKGFMERTELKWADD